jgi:predicted cobalt transporter CbtA
MTDLTLGAIVRRGLLAGVAAGVVASLVALFVVEPAIRDALAIEEARGATGGHEEELVGRTTQVVGGMVAAVAVAVCVGLVLAVVFAALRHRLPGATDFGRAALLAGCGFVAVALVPALKYPANPPGVGNPDTINTRTLQYVTLIAAAIAVTWLGFVVRAALARSGWQAPRAAAVTAVVVTVGYALLLIAFPATPDSVPADIPAGLLWRFRLGSLAELAAMWAALGITLGLLLTPGGLRADRPAADSVVQS